MIGGDLAVFVGEKKYGLRVSSHALSKMRSLISSNPQLKTQLPPELQDYFDGKKTVYDGTDMLVPIQSENLYVDHYKKKDSDVWAKSFIYSILHDVVYNEKLRVAKISALDGFQNVVRLWKIGNIKEEIFPAADQFVKLANILENHSGAGQMDIIWDDLIQFEDYYPPLEKLQSFDETYESILLGLGVHRSLIGGSDSSSGVTNAFVGLRNMMKRIDAVRRALVCWIETEMDKIDLAMGFRTKSSVKFSLNNLFDQQAYFKLLQDLNDRDIISNQSLIEKIGEDWDIEKSRIKEEKDDEDMPEKKGPFVNPLIPESNFDKQKELIDLQKEPSSEEGKTDDNKNDENANQKKSTKSKGRPPGSKDSVKRNRKFKAKSDLLLEANQIQAKLDKIVDPVFIGYNNVDNKRKLNRCSKRRT